MKDIIRNFLKKDNELGLAYVISKNIYSSNHLSACCDVSGSIGGLYDWYSKSIFVVEECENNKYLGLTVYDLTDQFDECVYEIVIPKWINDYVVRHKIKDCIHIKNLILKNTRLISSRKIYEEPIKHK